MARGKGLTAAQIQELVGGLAVTVEPIGRLQEYAGNAKEHTAEQVAGPGSWSWTPVTAM